VNRVSVPYVEVSSCKAAYGRTVVLDTCSFTVGHHERWAIIGPNGAGKSTLIKMVAGIELPASGHVTISGHTLRRLPARVRAQMMAYVPQKPDGTIPYTVHDFLVLARFAYQGLSGVASCEDNAAVAEAVAICDIGNVTGRMMPTLSGGELQRVLLAGAIAQKTPLLLLDEPTSFLDPAHEKLFFDALARLHESREVTLIMVTHDVNSALAHCTHILALKNRGVAFCGPVATFAAACPEALEQLFSVPFKTFTCTTTGARVFGAWGSGEI